jgi:hypothetical protein
LFQGIQFLPLDRNRAAGAVDGGTTFWNAHLSASPSWPSGVFQAPSDVIFLNKKSTRRLLFAQNRGWAHPVLEPARQRQQHGVDGRLLARADLSSGQI